MGFLFIFFGGVRADLIVVCFMDSEAFLDGMPLLKVSIFQTLGNQVGCNLNGL